MRLTTLAVSTAAAVLLASAAAFAKPPVDRVILNTVWDQNYIYFAFEVGDPDIQGASAAPNMPIADDDAVAVYLQTDRASSISPTDRSFRMVVSAAGGAEFSTGSGGAWQPKPIVTYKYAVRREGSLNDNQDDDTRFFVEIALPWSELGVAPDLGTQLGFNAVVRMKGERSGVVSLSKQAASEAEAEVPAKWSEMWLRGPVQPLVVQSEGRIMCNRTLNRAPVVDGRLQPAEYAAKAAISLEKPPFDLQRHVFRDVPVEHLVFAAYHLDATSAKKLAEAPHTPFAGIGPWTDPENSGAKRLELMDAQRAGIDVLAVAWPLDAEARKDLVRPLRSLSSAIGFMDAAKEDHPLLAPWVTLAGGGPVDTQALAQAVEDFALAAGTGNVARVFAPQSRGGKAAFPVFVPDAAAMAQADADAVSEALYKRFGARAAFVTAGEGSDGRLASLAEGAVWGSAAGEWISSAVLLPGVPRAASVIDRQGGAALASAWDQLLEGKPDWVWVQSFNDYRAASEVGASAQLGYLYMDSVALGASRLSGRREFEARYVYANVPEVVTPDYLSQARIRVRNGGIRPWRVADRIRLAYRWYQGGRLYSQGLTQVPLQADVATSGTAELTIGLVAVDADKDPLPEGDWLVLFDMIAGESQLFSSSGDRPLAVQVRVGKPAEQACTVLQVHPPAAVVYKSPANVRVTVRNDGSGTWKAGAGAKVVLSVAGSPQRSWSAPLAQDVGPGRIVETDVPVMLDSAEEAAGNADVMLRASVVVGEAAVPLSASSSPDALVSVVASLRSPSLAPPDQPVKGHKFGAPSKFQINVTNMSGHPWRDGVALVARWYSLDGRLLLASGGRGRMKKGQKPGEVAPVAVELNPPPYPGQYVVRWELEGESGGASGQDLYGGRPDSAWTQYVTVQGPALEVVDLSATYDTDVTASEASPSDGTMEAGAAYSAELLPPLLVPTAEPSPLFAVGLFGADPSGGASYGGTSSWRWISFSWPSKADGAKNAVTSSGQLLRLKDTACRRVHVLCAAAGPRVMAEFVLVYPDGSVPLKAAVGSWRSATAEDLVAYKSAWHMNAEGAAAGEAYLYDVVLQADPAKTLQAVRLPHDGSVKVVAITLERDAPVSQAKK